MTPPNHKEREIAEETCLKLYGKGWQKRVCSQHNFEIIKQALKSHGDRVREECKEIALKAIDSLCAILNSKYRLDQPGYEPDEFSGTTRIRKDFVEAIKSLGDGK